MEALTGDTYVLGRSLSYIVAVPAKLVGMAAGGTPVVWLGMERAMLVTAGAHLVAAAISRLFLSPARVPRPSASATGCGSIVRRTLRATRRWSPTAAYSS
ncbi:hypothetical protein ACIQF6_34475 [Kitasatospora sp. NPDC092948]|uniref:hypothetical protein n=1 Tax=Kitasatospora sp. NPDC092948 TaxID=3364088 RepID=UPI0038073E8A